VTYSTASLGLGATWNAPPAAQQPGSGTIDSGDGRILQAVWRGGHLWTATTISCTPRGDTIARACAAYAEVDTTGPTIAQTVSVSAAGAYYYSPALQIDGAGSLVTILSRSSSSEYASLYGAGRLSSDPLNTLSAPVRLKAGNGTYTEFCVGSGSPLRWGDFFGAAVDPSSTSTVWLAGEYARLTQAPVSGCPASDDWGTYIASVSIGAAATPTPSASPTCTPSPTASPMPAGGNVAGERSILVDCITASPTPAPSATATLAPTPMPTTAPSCTPTPTATASPVPPPAPGGGVAGERSILAACASPTATPTATPTPTTPPTSGPTSTPTSTPTSAPTPAPSATPAPSCAPPPSATPTAAPTSSLGPVASERSVLADCATPTPTPTPAPASTPPATQPPSLGPGSDRSMDRSEGHERVSEEPTIAP